MASPRPSDLDDRGSPVGTDIRNVVETGIMPLINTRIAAKGAWHGPDRRRRGAGAPHLLRAGARCHARPPRASAVTPPIDFLLRDGRLPEGSAADATCRELLIYDPASGNRDCESMGEP